MILIGPLRMCIKGSHVWSVLSYKTCDDLITSWVSSDILNLHVYVIRINRTDVQNYA